MINISGIVLTEEQKIAIERISDWYRKKEKAFFVLTGCAGT